MRVSFLTCAALALALVGCAGNNLGDTSSVNLTLSNPSSDFNVNLSQMTAATSFQRTSTTPLFIVVTQSPGPTGFGSRACTINIDTPVVGSDYFLVSGGTTYIQWDEAGSLGSNEWRSIGGKITLTQNTDASSVVKFTDVQMSAFGGSAAGSFLLNGTVSLKTE